MRLTEQQIDLLEKKGFKRWGIADRLYLSPENAGLEYDTYRSSGRISSATWRGQSISNSKAQKILWDGERSYIDVETCEVVSRSPEMRKLMNLMLEGVQVICPTPKAEAIED